MAGRNQRSDAAKAYRKLYNNNKWKKARLEHLYEHPECAYCRARGMLSGADLVDHIEPHKGDEKLFWDRSNWQSLCWDCHSGEKQLEENGRRMMLFDENGVPIGFMGD